MKNKLIGLRTIKTALAVTLGILLKDYIGVTSASIMSTAIITSIQSNIHDSFKNAFFRLLSTILGVALAISFRYINFANPFSAGLGVLVIIVFCNVANIKRALVLASLIFVAVLTYKSTSDLELFNYGLNRIIDTTVGVSIGSVFNLLFFKPNQQHFIMEEYNSIFPIMEDSLLSLIEEEKHIDQEKLLNELYKLNTAYINLKNDRKLKLNTHVNLNKIELINNRIRLAISLLIDLDQQHQPLILTNESRQMINSYFDDSLLDEILLEDDELKLKSEIALNYEVRKIIRTFRVLKKEIEDFQDSYQ